MNSPALTGRSSESLQGFIVYQPGRTPPRRPYGSSSIVGGGGEHFHVATLSGVGEIAEGFTYVFGHSVGSIDLDCYENVGVLSSYLCFRMFLCCRFVNVGFGGKPRWCVIAARGSDEPERIGAALRHLHCLQLQQRLVHGAWFLCSEIAPVHTEQTFRQCIRRVGSSIAPVHTEQTLHPVVLGCLAEQRGTPGHPTDGQQSCELTAWAPRDQRRMKGTHTGHTEPGSP